MMSKTTKLKMGRPKVKNKQEHQRIAVYPSTYKIFRKKAKKEGVYMIKFLEELAKNLDE